MKKLLMVLLLCVSIPAFAQLIDVAGPVGVGTKIANNSINQLKNALHTAEAQDIINKIKIEVLNYKSMVKRSYNQLKTNARQLPLLAKYEGQIESSAKEIIVTLFHVKQYECEQMTQLGAKLINLNNGKYDPIFCQYDNIMKFIFE